MLVGSALKNWMVGPLPGWEFATVTVAVAVVEPPGPVAVKVYVVVACGLTVAVPLAGRLLPTP